MKPISDELCQRPGQGVLFPEFMPVEDDGEKPLLGKVEKGSIAELLFDLWCLGQGVAVFAPQSAQGKEDRVIKLNGRFLGVQIKSGGMGNAGRNTCFSIWAGHPYSAANGGPSKRRPQLADADILVCIGLSYSNPSIESSFAHVRPWSESLPQALNFPNGTGWPSASDIALMLGM
jgi:hypothetical protein